MIEKSIHRGFEPIDLTAKRATLLWSPQLSMAQAMTKAPMKRKEVLFR